MALRDPLTGLPNRTAVSHIIDELVRCGRAATLLLLELEGLKRVNEAGGHRAGDELLAEVADILCAQMNAGGGICRYAGTEFAVIMPGHGSEREAVRMARHLCRCIHEQSRLVQAGGVRAVIGAAIFPRHVTQGHDLLQCADIALSMAKQRAHTELIVYRRSMEAAVRSKAAKLATARGRLASRHNLEVCFQPKIDLWTGSVAGYEALLRDRASHEGSKAPAWIKEALAEPDLARAVGQLVLDRSLAFLSALRRQDMPGHQVALNVTYAELSTPRWAGSLLKALDRRGLPASSLEIEVHESVFLGAGTKQALLSLRLLHQAGVRISLDDFGTGHASLLHLRTLPIDGLKIDRGFIASCDDPDSRAIIRAIVDLARALQMGVVAEGVETEQQHQFLVELGCREGQGYYYGRPKPASHWLGGHVAKRSSRC